MKKRIALAAALLLSLGTAVAGTLIYAQDRVSAAPVAASGSVSAEVTADTMAMWKATALATDYVPPKAPI